MPLRHPLAEAGMADSDAIRERCFPVRGKRPRRRLPHLLVGKDVGTGSAARE